MKDINKEILDLIVAHKSGGKTVEESLGIKICKSEEDHLFVTSSSNRNIKTYTMKPIGMQQVFSFSLEMQDIEQSCALCGKKQVLVKDLRLRK